MALFNQDEIKNILQEIVGNQLDEFRKKMKDTMEDDSLYFDTETTGRLEEKDALPVTLGTYQRGKGVQNYFLDYGSLSKNVENIFKAMTKRDNGELLDSAKGLAKTFGISLDELNTSNQQRKEQVEKQIRTEIERQLKNKVGRAFENGFQLINRQQVLDLLSQTKSAKGYNASFDQDMLRRYFDSFKSGWTTNKTTGKRTAQKSKTDNALMAKFEELGSKIHDIRAEQILPNLSAIDSAEIVQFIGNTKLQNFVKLLTGAVDSEAHTAGADAQQTYNVANNAAINQVLQAVAQTVETYAQRNNIAKTQTDSKGRSRYTNAYKQLFANVFDEMTMQLNAGNISQNTNVTNDSVQAVPQEVKSQISIEARKKVNQLYKTLNSTQKKALTGQHLIERLDKFGLNARTVTPARFGRDISDESVPLARQSTAYFLQEIIEQADVQGIGVVLNQKGNNIELGFYNKAEQTDESSLDLDRVAKIEIGLVDENGLIKIGNQSKFDLLTPVVDFQELEDGTYNVQTVMSTAMEQQLAGLSRLMKNEKFLGRMKSGNFGGAESLLGFIRNNAIQSAPGGASNSVLQELDISGGNRNPEELAGYLSEYSIMPLAQTLYRNPKFQEKVNDIYKELAEKKGFKKAYSVDANDLRNEEITAINVAMAYIARGVTSPDDAHIQNMQDGLIKRILSNSDTFEIIKRDLMPLVNSGFIPQMNSLKEEGFISGRGRFSGAQDVDMGNIFQDPSNRALNQVFNYRQKANQATNARGYMFTSEIGRELGVRYNDLKSHGQYTGAFTNDTEIYKVLSEIGATADQIVSVLEGGIILPRSMATELASYRDENLALDNVTDIVKQTISNAGFVDMSVLDSMQVGDRIQVNSGPLDYELQLGDLHFNPNDIIESIQKTSSGLKIVAQRYEDAGEGTKALLGTGGRNTLRFIDDETYNKLIKGLGLEGQGVKFLTEKGSLTSRNLMESFRGRISYIVDDYLAHAKGGRSQENIAKVEEALKAMPVIGKAFKRVGDQFELTASYDYGRGEYVYEDASGKILKLFSEVDKNGNQIDEGTLIRQALVEVSQDGFTSAIETLGRNLLGDKRYASTRGLIDTSINIARETPYFTPTGGGNATTAEAQQGVRVTRRERDAFDKMIERYLPGSANQEAVQTYANIQKEILNRRGKLAQEAQSNIDKLLSAKENALPRSSAPQIKLVWGKTSAPNEIDISGIADHIEYGRGGVLGVADEDWQNTIGAYLTAKRAELGDAYANAPVIMDLEQIANASGGNFEISNNAHKIIKLADIGHTMAKDDSFMPSITDTATTRLISVIKDGIETKAKTDLTEFVDRMYETYEDAATNKDSELVRRAESTYMPHATHAKAIGQNVGWTRAMAGTGDNIDASAYNTLYVNADYFKQLLGTQAGASQGEYAKNIQALSYLYRSADANFIDKDLETSFKKYENIIGLQDKSINELKQIEAQLIEAITGQVESGRKISAQAHRYPSTSGLDLRGSFLGINNNVDTGAIAVGRGTSLLFNADYDGDKIQAMISMLSGNYSSFDEFNKAYQGSVEISQIESRIAQRMFEWEQSQKDLNDATDNGDDIVRELSARQNAEFGSVISKYNKGYVGRFSNLSTNLRRSSQATGWGVTGANATQEQKENALYSSIIAAFTEALEQDAISAKKVMARLIKNNDVVGLNDLSLIEDAMRSGDLATALDYAVKLGIVKTDDKGFLDGRQFKLAQFTAEEVDPETAKELGLSNGISVNALKTAFSRMIDYIGKENMTDMMRNDETRLKSKGLLRGYNVGRSPSVSNRNQTRTTQPINVNVEFTPLPTKQRTDGEHGYTFETAQGVMGNNYSITEILGMGKPELPQWEKNKGIVKSAEGTYMHKIAELLTKTGKESVFDLTDAEQQEVKQARDNLRNAIGSVSDELVATLNARAESAYAIAKQAGVVSENTMSEVTLGGFLEGVGLIGGQADLVTFDKLENGKYKATLGDWKFSERGGAGDTETVQERIAQVSAYRAMLLRALQEEQVRLNEIGADNLTDEENAELEDITNKIEALQEENYTKIVRNYTKNGKVVNEILTAKLIDPDKIMRFLQDTVAHGSKDYGDLIDWSEVSFSGFSPNASKSGYVNNVFGSGTFAFQEGNQGQAISQFISSYSKIKKLNLDILAIQEQMNLIEDDDSESAETTRKDLIERKERFEALRDTIEKSLPVLREFNGLISIDGRVLDAENSQKFLLKREEVDWAYEAKEYDKLSSIQSRANRALSSSFELNTGIFGNSLEDTEKAIKEISNELKEMDSSQSALVNRQKIYKDSLDDEASALTKLSNSYGKITSYEQQKQKLIDEGASDDSQEVAHLNTLIKKEQELVKLQQEKIKIAQKQREGTKLDEQIDAGDYGSDVAQWRRNLYETRNPITSSNMQEQYNKGMTQASSITAKQASAEIQRDLANQKQIYRVMLDIQKVSQKMQNQSGEELRNSQTYVSALQERLGLLQSQKAVYDAQNHTLNGVQLNEEQIVKYEQQKNALASQYSVAQAKINASQREQRNILQEIAGGFRQAFRNMTDASIAYTIIGEVRQGITQLIQTTKELDSALVDLQIASGNTRNEVKEMMLGFSDLGYELGRSTQEIAVAANDWLRAGYAGQEATELTKASIQLSTLGMIESSEATSYLISVLKGWKMEAQEVTDVVDMLTAVDIKIGIVSFLW